MPEEKSLFPFCLKKLIGKDDAQRLSVPETHTLCHTHTHTHIHTLSHTHTLTPFYFLFIHLPPSSRPAFIGQALGESHTYSHSHSHTHTHTWRLVYQGN